MKKTVLALMVLGFTMNAGANELTARQEIAKKAVQVHFNKMGLSLQSNSNITRHQHKDLRFDDESVCKVPEI